ncbi:PilZ domain-containing protein [Desulfocurvus sp. DL9XJH121]
MNVFASLTTTSSSALERVSAGIDRAFLDRIQGSFDDLGMTRQLLDIIGWTVVAAALAAGLVLLANHLLFKRKRRLPSNMVGDPHLVSQLLRTAQDQRSKVEFSFSRDDQAAPSLHCSIEDIKKQEMVLDAGGAATVHQGWLGRPVSCFFRLMSRTNPGQPQFYSFDSEITGVVKRTDGSALVSVALPSTLTMQQKRVHMRMAPPMRCLLGLALWPEPMGPGGVPEPEIKRWGKPLLVYHELETTQLSVANLSAGGMRIDLPRESVKDTEREFEVGERYVVLMKLLDPENKTKERIWCLARIQNRYEDQQTRTLELGLRFLAQGVPAPGETPTMTWRASAQGLDKLGNWIQRRHLEQFRSKGGA